MPDSPTAGRSAAGRLPLPALLSQALVAFTIEFDNEAERQIPHRTTDHGGTARASSAGPGDARPRGVWLVSMAMWLNCMRYVGAEPVRAADVRRLARGDTNLDGMRRWGYVSLTPDPADTRRKPPPDALILRATSRGLRAKDVWEPLTGVIEQRWRDRYGDAVARLACPLRAIAGQLGDWLPDCLPILGYGLLSAGQRLGEDRYAAIRADYQQHPPEPAGPAADALPMPWLLARVLLSLAVEFELEARISLAIAANVLRLIGADGTRVKDLPALSGVSPAGLAMATGYLQQRGLAVVGAGSGGQRWKSVRLTPAGSATAAASCELLAAIEERWAARFGAPTIAALRQALEALAGDSGSPGETQSPLFAAIEPYPDGWRASVRRPVTLPHYPMVLHRGGYPDGS
jgi:DNA-binding MarR family transcriptional regulator